MRKFIIIAIASGAMATSGCGENKYSATVADADSDIVAQYRDTVLRMSDVVRMLPPGISSADSATLTQSIIDQWIDGFLIEDLAASQIDDMDRIQRLTEMYRRSLIADSYRRKMRALGVQPVDGKMVREYYRRHLPELKLERPIVKGLFIKLPTSSRYLDDVRAWMKDGGATAVDELENIGLKETVRFQYFIDKWVDLDAITEKIPSRIGDGDTFVEAITDYETENNGTTYIIHLTDFRHSGNLMPEDYAAPVIEDRIKNSHLADYEKGLIKALRATAIEKEILKVDNDTK